MLTPKSVLPESLHAKLGDLGAKLEQQIALGREFDGILDEMSDLKASTIVRADSAIAYSANLQKMETAISASRAAIFSQNGGYRPAW